MSRKTVFIGLAAVLLFGLGGAVSAYVWHQPPPQKASSPGDLLQPPLDPALFEQYRAAYRASLQGVSPPGLLEQLEQTPPAPLPPLGEDLAELLPFPTEWDGGLTQTRFDLPSSPEPPLARSLMVPRARIPEIGTTPRRFPLVHLAPSLATGTHRAFVDAQGILSFLEGVVLDPAENDLMYVTSTSDGCLYLGSSQQVERWVTRHEQAAATVEQGRRVRRCTFSALQPVRLDDRGCLALPNNKLAPLGLLGEVVLIGIGDGYEIWNRDAWEAYRQGKRLVPLPLQGVEAADCRNP